MPRTALLRPSSYRLVTKARGLTVVVLLAAVVTAGAPSFIRIQPGDTLSEIAQRHGTSVAALRQLNALPGNGVLYAGDTLRVPGSGSAHVRSGAGRERGHTVRAGETLSGIAARYGVSVSSLRTRNRLSSAGRIYVGQRLAVPAGTRSGGTTRGTTASSGGGISPSVSSSAATNRALLRSRSHPSKAQVRKMVASTARRHGVSPSLAVAVAYHESGFQQRVVSGVNAIGVMQVLPSTGRVLGQQHGRRLDLLKASDNITAGVLLLRQLLRSTGSERMTLAGYYQGLGSISRKGLLPQTHDYIRSIGYLRPRFANG